MTKKTPRKTKAMEPKAPATPEAATEQLFGEIRTLIEETRGRVAQAVNTTMVALYWKIGQRIYKEILKERRAEYGAEILPTLSAKLVPSFGQGFSPRNLARMVRFAEVFPDVQIVQTLSGQLSWSHFIEIIYLKDQLQRDFYAEMCRIERWTVRTLRAKIDGMLFERTALSKNTEALIEQELKLLRTEDRLTPDMVFRDPYFLDFLGLADTYSEKDLEAAILREIEKFLLELGSDFAFMARQKRMTVDNEDFHLDLLFYHRGLRRLVAVELKLGKFKPGDLGQMLLYLRWLDKYERRADEAKPIGLILCAGKTFQSVELLDLDNEDIRVAEYWTELPPKEVLQAKLTDAVRLSRARLENLPSDTEGETS